MSENPTINCAENGPYLVKNLETLKKSSGEVIETQSTIALCRCEVLQSDKAVAHGLFTYLFFARET